MSRGLYGYIPSLENIMPFGGKRVAICFRRKRADATDFSTWGGSKIKLDMFRERN
jgi:hypothetical protein